VLAQAGDEGPLQDLHLLDAESADRLQLSSAGLHTDDRTGTRWASREIRARRMHHGFVVAVEARQPFGEFDLVAVEQATIVAALE
jgi:purine catabolism regulator